MREVGKETAVSTRTETRFKSPLLAFMLACRHFDGRMVRVVAAVHATGLLSLVASLAMLVQRKAMLAGAVAVGVVAESGPMAWRRSTAAW